ncbi:MAG TPA: phosphodiester glycosidase family protein [Candidatus Sulfotelmatobacter sp.]|nr:phosphodiester glycosidase family protein [Candidatus Sulfotelmatobacter sp.]
MISRRLPIGRLAALVAVAVGAIVIATHSWAPRWRPLAPGIDFALMRADRFCRRGSPDVAVLRIDPVRARIAVHHYSRLPDPRPLPVTEWLATTRAIAVFNAGQYYPDYGYMGILVSGGRPISAKPHPEFRAALVAEPVGGGAGAHVLDLAPESLAIVAQAWREVAQSFMLFDSDGELRVRHTDQDANRTVVGEDRLGHLLVFTTEGSYTLWDLAQWLKESRLGLVHAMSMDGGLEAEMCIRSGRFAYASFGHWNPRASRSSDPDDAGRVPLPAVISVSAR